jgi:Protein of unknown function DUF262/Protein of unknown function (DUF1524)
MLASAASGDDIRRLCPDLGPTSMLSHLTSRALALEQLFSAPFLFDAPSYQRPYAWTTEEAGRLLDDLLVAHDAAASSLNGTSHDYFIGAILLDDPIQTEAVPMGWPWTGDLRPFHVVDGQQRLVTLTILFVVLRDLLATVAIEASIELSDHILDERSKRPLARARVVLRGRENVALAELMIANSSGSVSSAARDTLTVAEQRLVQVRDHFVATLENHDAGELTAFKNFLLKNCAVVVIATKNIDRAHRMFTVLNGTGKELARSDILKAELLGGIVPDKTEQYVALWDRMADELGADFEPLFSHVRSAQGRTQGPIIETIRQLISEAGGAAPFIDATLFPAAKILKSIKLCAHSGTPQSKEISSLLRYWSWLQGQEWVPPVLAWWLRCGDDSLQLLTFMRDLDKHIWGARIIGLGVDRRMQRLAPVMAAIRTGAPIDDIRRLLALSKDDHRSASRNLRDLYARNQSTCKLVLLRINDQLSGQPENADPSSLTVEHVLPVKSASSSQWREWFPNSDERSQCTACLGNLTLVSRQQNEKARNLDFEMKLPIYFPPGRSVTMRILEDFRGLRLWRPSEVWQRDTVLLDSVATLWDLGPRAKR